MSKKDRTANPLYPLLPMLEEEINKRIPKKLSKLTLYNPLLRRQILERISGYSTSTFGKWESNPEATGPRLNPIVVGEEGTSKPRKYYTTEDLNNLYKYLATDDSEKSVVRPNIKKPIVIAIWNNKGGVGKTVITQQLAATFSGIMGLRTLVVDTDAQSDCSYIMDCLEEATEVKEDYDGVKTLRHVFGFVEESEDGGEPIEHTSTIEDATITLSQNLDVIPANDDISDLDYDFAFAEGVLVDDQKRDFSKIGNVKYSFLEDLPEDKYDVVIFDCGPNKGFLNLNILYAADRLLVPVNIEAKCLHSLRNVRRFLKKLVTMDADFGFEQILFVPNQYDSRVKIKTEALEKLRAKLAGSGSMSSVCIPRAAAVDQCINNKEPIFTMASDTKSSRGNPASRKVCNEFWFLAHEILGWKRPKAIFPEVEV